MFGETRHRNQAPRPQNRHRMVCERKSLKKPEATGSAGRCEPGRGRLTAPSLCPATLFHPSRCSYPGIFSTLPLWGRIRLLGLVAGRFPTLGRKPPHRPSQARETRCFSAGKDGCCAPEGFSLTKPPAWSCTQGETGGAWVRAAGRKKAAARFCRTAAC